MLTKLRTTTKSTKASLDPFQQDREKTAEECAAEERQAAIDGAVDRRAKDLKREQAQLSPDQRLSKDECWVQAQREVHAEIKRNRRAERARRIRADVDSARTRNQHLLGPWYAGAAYAASGEVGAVLVETASFGAGTGVAAAGAAAATWLGWRRITALPEKYWSRLRAGLGAGCATCLSLTVLPWEWHTATLAGGTAALVAAAAQFWRDREPTYPPMGGYGVTDHETAVATVTDNEAASMIPPVAADVIADWNTYVGIDQGPLPGATLELREHSDYGVTFTVGLVRGKQRWSKFQAAIPDIAAALNLPEYDVHPDPNPDSSQPLRPLLTITTSRPDTTYTGPRIVREGGDVFIEVGPYIDGQGVVRHHVLADQLTAAELAAGKKPGGSVMGGFALGDKGSGKSRLLEILALGHRELGIEVWWLDPFGSTSSPLLSEYAEWPLSGLDSPDGRVFGNVEDLLAAMEGVCEVRSDEHSEWGWSGFQHSSDRPAIVVFIDECHEVFTQGYADRFADIDRKSRKLGLALLGASQDPTQATFGSQGVLRRGLCGTNAYALKYGGNNVKLCFPTYEGPSLAAIPERRGYGYAPNGRQNTMFQNRYTADLEPFFRARPAATLDQLATVGAGDAYARRHEAAAENLAAVRDRLQAYRAGTLKPGEKTKQAKAATPSAPKQQSGATGSVSYLFPGTQAPTVQDAAVPEDDLTDRQRRVLAMLGQSQLTAKYVATELGVTGRTISNDLRRLREAHLVRIVDENAGLYVATSALENHES